MLHLRGDGWGLYTTSTPTTDLSQHVQEPLFKPLLVIFSSFQWGSQGGVFQNWRRTGHSVPVKPAAAAPVRVLSSNLLPLTCTHPVFQSTYLFVDNSHLFRRRQEISDEAWQLEDYPIGQQDSSRVSANIQLFMSQGHFAPEIIVWAFLGILIPSAELLKNTYSYYS